MIVIIGTRRRIHVRARTAFACQFACLTSLLRKRHSLLAAAIAPFPRQGILSCRTGQPGIHLFFAAFATASQVSQSFASNLYHVSPVKRHSTPTENSLTTSCIIPVSILCCRFLVLFFILDATVPSHSGLYSAVTRLQLHVTLGLGLFPPQQPASRNASLTSHQHLAPCTVRCDICDPLADAFRCMTPQGSPVHHATACAPERRSFYCLEIQLHHHSSRSYFIIRSKPP